MQFSKIKVYAPSGTQIDSIGLDFETTVLDGYTDDDALGAAGLDPLRSRPRLLQV